MRLKVPWNEIKSPTIKSVWKDVPTPVTVVPADVAEPTKRVFTGEMSAEKDKCWSELTLKKNDFTLRVKSIPVFNLISNKDSLYCAV